MEFVVAGGGAAKFHVMRAAREKNGKGETLKTQSAT
jgi:hypothetical protein